MFKPAFTISSVSTGWDEKSDQLEDLDFKGVPIETSELSWKETSAIVFALLSFGVATSIVFVQRWAFFWELTGQFVWIGACLTVMQWCTQPFIRRLLLVTSLRSPTSSTLQSIDAILRSDPMTRMSHWSSRLSLSFMLTLPVLLSAAYKTLGGGQSIVLDTRAVQVGLTGPPGTQNVGYGLSLFFNATLPWFEKPGMGPYGFNILVLGDNATAMLDGPMPDDVRNIQASLGDKGWMTLTGNVSALVCFLDSDITYNKTRVTEDFENTKATQPNSKAEASQHWVWNGYWNEAIYLPNKFNNSDVWFSYFNVSANENFGDRTSRYSLLRQTFSAQWRITAASIKLEAATLIDGQSADGLEIFTTNRVSIPELMPPAIAEYDTKYRSMSGVPAAKNTASYAKEVKTDTTRLASAIWARFVAFYGPETWLGESRMGLGDEQASALLYKRIMTTAYSANTVKRDWRILGILAFNPILLTLALMTRVLYWPRTPVGSGFGLITLLASTDKDSKRLLEGAGLSGKLNRPVPVVLDVDETPHVTVGSIANGLQAQSTGRIVTYLGTSYTPRSERLEKGTFYS